MTRVTVLIPKVVCADNLHENSIQRQPMNTATILLICILIEEKTLCTVSHTHITLEKLSLACSDAVTRG